jgi:rhamnose utilization protein RhaD (predicted bifunctional aldolase and dehydrogenase)
MAVSQQTRTEPAHCGEIICRDTVCRELEALADLSARLGSDPLLVQASSGNTSVKLDDVLWIKASGKWLARAREGHTFVPVGLTQARAALRQIAGICSCNAQCAGLHESIERGMHASIETAMHAAIPHRVVIHVHSVKTLAWAVRADGARCLSERLAGLEWKWIPYVASGLPLAHAVLSAIAGSPHANVFVLANHGLVVCGDDCNSTEALLRTVENRVAVQPRAARGFDRTLGTEIEGLQEWRLPETERIHALSTDAASLAILKAGVLYPCQAMFLGANVPLLTSSAPFSHVLEHIDNLRPMPPFWIVEGRGLVIGRGMTSTQLAVLDGLAEVVQRIDASAPLRYIDDGELDALMTEDAHFYCQSAESNAGVDVSR